MKLQVTINKQLKEKGVTIVALVITIIILLILAGVSISAINYGKGLINFAEGAREMYINESDNELETLIKFTNTIDNYDKKIDTPKPIVIAKQAEQQVNIRNDELLHNYFIIDENARNDIKKIRYIDESDYNKEIINTNELIGGEHSIKCIVTLNDEREETAQTKLLVGKILYISGETNVDEYLNEEISIIGTTEDSSIITNNELYLSMMSNINLYNVTVKATAICMSQSDISIRLKNCILNLSGYSTSYVSNIGIISNSYHNNDNICFDNCVFATSASKRFGSWASTTPKGYIKENCNPNQLSQFYKYNYPERAEWQLNIY